MKFTPCLRRWRAVVSCGCLIAMLSLTSCESDKVEQKTPPPPPPPTFTGPGFMHGTVSSLCRLEGYKPLLVSGYGLVVGLQGTGMANDVPSYLRQRLLNELRRRGISASRPPLYMSAEQLLASPDVAVVTVEGLIPPGATRGTPFDLWVTALDGTQTTNLEGGTLWSTELGFQGANPNISFVTPLAKARGPLYLDPFDDNVPQDRKSQFQRQAVVLSGGVATQSRVFDLVLNQPSWTRSALIANRINDRFRKGTRDKEETAVAQNDSIVRVNVPARFASNPDRLIELIGHLFLNASPEFINDYSKELVKTIAADAKWSRDVSLCWEAMGRNVIPTLRGLYRDPSLTVQLAALAAGARLEDEGASIPLEELGTHPTAAVRKQVAENLVHLPRSLRGSAVLKKLLDDEDPSVRIAAYLSLSDINDPLISDGRVVLTERIGEVNLQDQLSISSRDRRDPLTEEEEPKRVLRFILDVVPAEKPLIYITTTDLPRIVIFSPNTGFKGPGLVKLWNNRLMIRASSEGQPLNVFFQGRGKVEGKRVDIAPAVANLVLLMGRVPEDDSRDKGLGLQFGRIANALHGLSKAGMLEAPIQFQPSVLAVAIANAKKEEEQLAPRPDTNLPESKKNSSGAGRPQPLNPEKNRDAPSSRFGPDGTPMIDGSPVDLNPQLLERAPRE